MLRAARGFERGPAAVAVLSLMLLSGCVPFGVGDSKTYTVDDSIAKELKVGSLGKTTWTGRFGTGVFSDPPTLELYIDGADAAKKRDERLTAAGFTSSPSPSKFEYWQRDGSNGPQEIFVRSFAPGTETQRHKPPQGQSERFTTITTGIQLFIQATPKK